MSKSIGIITMHRVLNYGSVLQAYALQHTIQELGNTCELIDYYYPNKIKKEKTNEETILKLYYKYFENKKKKLFDIFYSRHLILSRKSYYDKESLQSLAPVYDIYITGSDQVWNVNNLKDDASFLLSFARDQSKKIAYAASFSIKDIPEQYRQMYKKYLLRYNAITVREENGCQILKSLANINADVVLDPVFLLSAHEWNILANSSKLVLKKEPYILVYALAYAYNPYPYLTKLIRAIKKRSKMHIVLLNFSVKQIIGLNNVTNLHDVVSPEDFLMLFRDAAFIITTSFHGAAFALNFSCPFYVVVDTDLTGDNRIFSLLKLLGAEDRAIKKGQSFPDFSMEMSYANVEKTIEKYRIKSRQFLIDNLT
ncbi:MAG: polysaccharide pyruvyl transferase family protein [Bacteroidales bacterium]|jgi:hypothetical protein|nr:polysaccharide pyruvyl transferase family protein [Bacteroidales bacterium]